MDKWQLELYIDYPISNYGCATATSLSAMVNGEVSHGLTFKAKRPQRIVWGRFRRGA